MPLLFDDTPADAAYADVSLSCFRFRRYFAQRYGHAADVSFAADVFAAFSSLFIIFI